MRRVMLGACLVGLLAAATGASAASAAEPAFFECVRLKGGHLDRGCVGAGGKGGFELVEATPRVVTIRGSGSPLSPFVPATGGAKGGGEIACASTKLTGFLATPTRLAGILIVSKGCHSPVNGKMCTTIGPGAEFKPGTVFSSTLEATLGYIDAAEHRIGVDLKAEGGGEIERFGCEGVGGPRISGSVIGEITPVGAITREYALAFTRDGEGFQDPFAFEGGLEDVPIFRLTPGPESHPGSLAATIVYKGEKLLLKG